jgi:NAD(P)-dependent dehydrogenase (short-subunit alcohol dehydrogenase family)
VEFSLLDLSDLRSVQSFAKAFLKSKQPLHVLMNSAGVMACPFTLTAQGVEMQFGTNHLGHFLLTKLLLPALRRSQPSRVVTTSSAAHYFPEIVGGHNMTDVFADSNATYSPWPAYGRSKLANVLFTMRLADELRGDRVYANALHPGGVRTNLKRHAEATTTQALGKQAAAAVWALIGPLMLSPAQVRPGPRTRHSPPFPSCLLL